MNQTLIKKISFFGFIIGSILISLVCSKQQENQELVVWKLVNNYYNSSPFNYKLNEQEIKKLTKLLKEGYKPDLYIKRGFYYLNTLQIEEAKKDFSTVLKSDSNNVAALTGLALYYGKIYDYNNYQSYVDKIFSIKPDEVAYFLRARTHSNIISKLNDLDTSIKLNPNFYFAYLTKATVFELNDSLKSALKVLDILGSKNPDQETLYSYYDMRIDINEKLHRYHEVLSDLSNLAKLENWSEDYLLERKIEIYKKLNDNNMIRKLEKRIKSLKHKIINKKHQLTSASTRPQTRTRRF